MAKESDGERGAGKKRVMSISYADESEPRARSIATDKQHTLCILSDEIT